MESLAEKKALEKSLLGAVHVQGRLGEIVAKVCDLTMKFEEKLKFAHQLREEQVNDHLVRFWMDLDPMSYFTTR